jgi:hypothetical protein
MSDNRKGAAKNMGPELSRSLLEDLVREKVSEVSLKPEYVWADTRQNYMRESDRPVVRVGMANCRLDYDLWEGLRSPASIGLHPVGIREIWEFFATKDVRRTRPDGTTNYLATPESFESAMARFKRVVVISAMLPLSPEMLEGYRENILSRSSAPFSGYCKAYAEVNKLFEESLSLAAMQLLSKGRAVVPMTSKTVDEMSENAVPKIYQGKNHGPCKGGHYPQKSIGVLTGLVQMGVSRMAFRDELLDDSVARMIGPLRSIIVFDAQAPVTDGSGEIVDLSDQWRKRLFSIADFTNTDSKINRLRFCRFLEDPGSDADSCSACISYCPSGAQAKSTPNADGSYASTVRDQKSRWYGNDLQFAFSDCLEERTQKKELFPDFMCGRCMVVCVLEGKRSKEAAIGV